MFVIEKSPISFYVDKPRIESGDRGKTIQMFITFENIFNLYSNATIVVIKLMTALIPPIKGPCIKSYFWSFDFLVF